MSVRFTRRAESELLQVAEWSRETFDPDVAEAYIDALRDGLAMAEKIPGISREVRGRHNARRILRGRHWLYFIFDDEGILVLRLVHTRQLPGDR